MSFFDMMAEIDAVIAEGASCSAAKKLKILIAREPKLGAYAASKLEGSDWLPLLTQPSPLGLTAFACMLTAEGVAMYLFRCAQLSGGASEGGISHAMACLAADASPNVRALLARTAAHLSPQYSILWAERETQCVKEQRVVDGMLALDLGSLISHLAKGGEVDSALSLAAALLGVLPGPEVDRKRDADATEGANAFLSPEPAFRISKYEYDEVLQKNIRDLAKLAPERTFELLSDLVEKTMVFGLREPAKEKPNDLSLIRRPAIEDHGQNQDHGVEHQLINTWRDTAEGMAQRQPERLEDLVRRIEEREWNLFRRLALYLLRVTDNAPIALVEARLAKREYLRNFGVHHEFWNLLHDHFGQISPEGQALVLNSIAEGIDRDDVSDLSQTDKERYRRHDEYRWLLAVEPYLEGQWVERLETLRNEFGVPSMPPDFLAWSGGGKFVTPKSPLTQEQIAAMPVDDLIHWLKAWQPTGDWTAPTPDALGSQLSALVQSAPEKWAGDLARFQDAELDPTYQRCLVAGFTKLQEAGKAFPWPSVLAFCQWLVDQPLEIPGRVLPQRLVARFEADRDRRSTRLEIARLLGKAFQPKEGSPPSLDLRESYWAVIAVLVDDTNPTRDDEDQRGQRGVFDALTTSLNTVRGVALHDAMEYAMWIYRQIESGVKEVEGRNPNWTDMPEVREVLESRFDMERGFGWSTTDRAVLGQWLPQIVHVDPKWVATHIPDLFPESAGLQPQRDAFWGAYLCYSRLYGNVYEVLRAQYLDAVRALAQGADETNGDKPEVRLAQHVMMLCMWGTDDLQPGGLVDTFFQSAKPSLAGEALSFLEQLLDTKDPIPDDVIERIRSLWEWRVKSAGGIEKMTEPELAAFCLWFTSSRLDLQWSLRYLPAAIGRGGKRWAEDRILRRLFDSFDEFPKESLDCLRLMVERAQDNWFFMPSKDRPTWQILDKGLSHSAPTIRDAAESITHLLGSKGHLGYRELLQSHWQRSVGDTVQATDGPS